ASFVQMRKKKGFKSLFNPFEEPFIFPAGRQINDDDYFSNDIAIYVVSRQAGEGKDKRLDNNEFNITEEEKNHLRYLRNKFNKLILIINSGSTMDLSVMDEINIDALIFYIQQGEEGGNALADILFGNVSPSARLTDTWVNNYEDIPFAKEYSYLNNNVEQEYYNEGIYVGYRYFDKTSINVRYHFGHGLSYTRFNNSLLYYSFDGEKAHITIKTKNVGDYESKESILIYACLSEGSLEKEKHRLVAFEKTKSLKPNEEVDVDIAFPLEYLKSFDENRNCFVIEKGNYVIKTGESVGALTDLFQIEIKEDIIFSKLSYFPESKGLKTLQIAGKERKSTSKILTITNYQPKEIDNITEDFSNEVNAVFNKLTTKEKVELVVGQGFGCMMNANKIIALGAVGKTSDKLYKKGLYGVCLSDGPAGLRILKAGAVRKSGSVKMKEFLMDFFNFFPDYFQRWMKPNKKDKLLYQYCTAFPVGTALASSFNKQLVEKVGQSIAREMEKYYVTYFLGPAMNIHRNPLCGRNFEYYSEDPVVSGLIGAAMIKGVESIPGCYATMKHFACNNQEENRNKTNANVSIRALREIYLRGFEIAVKEGRPSAVMSSYNKINGVYSPNNGHLLNDILRNEWGYRGLVMTDWYATNKDLAVPYLCIDNGNDLIMPGDKNNKKNILKALKENRLSEDKLNLSCKRIIKQILESGVARKVDIHAFGD
ncbi:MAG: glycoside hydrolase family 3 C-terminal domain-containing protein, partial [Bacilli bacterium]|nr:glycoside hydrolase family 3 C-terminal domain-containing protein [Bacilli bacterium]